MSEELKPCPHCGGTDLQIVETDMTCCIRCCTKGCWLEGPHEGVERFSNRSMERPSARTALDEGTAHGAGILLV